MLRVNLVFSFRQHLGGDTYGSSLSGFLLRRGIGIELKGLGTSLSRLCDQLLLGILRSDGLGGIASSLNGAR